MKIMQKLYILSFLAGLLMLPVHLAMAFPQEPADSVMVDVAYGKQEPWKVSSGISTVSGAKLDKTTSTSLGTALQGMLTGLTYLQESGEPGNDFNIYNMYARGLSSFASSQKILVFVDGFESSMDFLTIEEIESVSLLKDASALALYGMRGANGVLLITTKKGRYAPPEVTFRVQTGIQTPTFMDSPINSAEYAELYNQALENDGLPVRYLPSDIAAYRDGSDPYLHPNVNWKDQIMKSVAPLTSAEITFRGGNKSIRYYMMTGFMLNGGLYKGTDPKSRENSNVKFNRFNFRANLDVNITKHLTSSLYANVGIGSRLTPGGDYSANSMINSIWATAPNAFPVYNPDGSYGGNSALTNPVGNLLSRGLNKDNLQTSQLIFNLKYDFSALVKGLSATASVAYNGYVDETSPKTRDYARYALSQSGTDESGAPIWSYSQYGTDVPLASNESFKTDNSRVNFKIQADYNRVFNGHGIDALLFFMTDSYSEYQVRENVRYVNYAGRFTYNYKKRYIAEFTASCMGSDNFAPGHRYGFFPAGSAGWVVSNENFMKDVTWIDFLKAKVSYGSIGNNQTEGRFMFDALYGSIGSYIFGIGSSYSGGFGEQTLANENFRWEKKNIFNVGLEATFLKSLTMNFDYFHEIHNDILMIPSASILGLVGASFRGIMPYMNIGKVTNRGFELTMRYDHTPANKLKYYVEGSTWFARNTVNEKSEGIKLYDYQYNTGRSVGIPFVLVADGFYKPSDFDAEGNLKDGYPVPQFSEVKPGDIKYVDQNKDMVIDANDTYPGKYSSVPELSYALNAGIRWKGLSLDASFYGVANREIYVSGNTIYSFQNNSTASRLALDSWTESNQNASYPRLSTVNFANNYRTSTFWKRNGNYLRLRNLRIGYQLPESATKAMSLKGMEVYFNATNLFTISGMKGCGDPEIGNLTNYPIMRTFNIGIKLIL